MFFSRRITIIIFLSALVFIVIPAAFAHAEDSTLFAPIQCDSHSQEIAEESDGRQGVVRGCVQIGNTTRVGKWFRFAPDGSLSEIWHFNEIGLMDGDVYRFYVEGMEQNETQSNRAIASLFQLGNEKNEIKHGAFLSHARFKNGKASGKWTLWHANAAMKEIRYYSQGKMHGFRKHWTSLGEPDGMECFVNGERSALESCSKL